MVAAAAYELGISETTVRQHLSGLFRRYWAIFSPGIILIRYEVLRLVRAAAERHPRLEVSEEPDSQPAETVEEPEAEEIRVLVSA